MPSFEEVAECSTNSVEDKDFSGWTSERTGGPPPTLFDDKWSRTDGWEEAFEEGTTVGEDIESKY